MLGRYTTGPQPSDLPRWRLPGQLGSPYVTRKYTGRDATHSSTTPHRSTLPASEAGHRAHPLGLDGGGRGKSGRRTGGRRAAWGRPGAERARRSSAYGRHEACGRRHCDLLRTARRPRGGRQVGLGARPHPSPAGGRGPTAGAARPPPRQSPPRSRSTGRSHLSTRSARGRPRRPRRRRWPASSCRAYRWSPT